MPHRASDVGEERNKMSLYEKAKQAIMDLYSDTSVSAEETRRNLNSLTFEIEVLVDTLSEKIEDERDAA